MTQTEADLTWARKALDSNASKAGACRKSLQTAFVLADAKERLELFAFLADVLAEGKTGAEQAEIVGAFLTPEGA